MVPGKDNGHGDQLLKNFALKGMRFLLLTFREVDMTQHYLLMSRLKSMQMQLSPALKNSLMQVILRWLATAWAVLQ